MSVSCLEPLADLHYVGTLHACISTIQDLYIIISLTLRYAAPEVGSPHAHTLAYALVMWYQQLRAKSLPNMLGRLVTPHNCSHHACIQIVCPVAASLVQMSTFASSTSMTAGGVCVHVYNSFSCVVECSSNSTTSRYAKA